MVVDSSSKVLRRLHCLNDCAIAILDSLPVPECVCYVPEEVEYKPKRSTNLAVYTKPSKTGGKKTQLLCTSKHRIFLAVRTDKGHWVKIKKIFESGAQIPLQPADQWIVFSENDLVPVNTDSEHIACWEDAVDHTYMRNLNVKEVVVPPDDSEVAKLRAVPSGWTVRHDQALAQLMLSELQQWSAKDFVDSVEATENRDEANNILNEDSNRRWTAYGSVYELVLNMKKNSVISSLAVFFPDNVEQTLNSLSMPKKITVYGGEKDSQVLLNTCEIEHSSLVNDSITVYSGQSQHFPTIKLVFADNANGSGIQVKSLHFEGSFSDIEKSDVESGIFTKKAIDSQPLLTSYEPDIIGHRSLLLQRVVQLFDSVLMYMMPIWEYSVGSFDSLLVLQELLPLSKKRKMLINTLLKQTEDRRSSAPTLYIRRNLLNIVDKPGVEETVFSQIYSGLMKEGANEDEKLTYRFSAEVTQWWRCVFIGEGIIDQGGGFRDTVSDIAEELCPCAADSPLLLPFFIPCPNQQSGVASNYRDAYMPNPACMEFNKYEWIGKLMGACLRSEENLAITLSSFFWKLLAEHKVSWADYMSVDETQVMTMNEIEKMNKDSYDTYFSGMRTWSVMLSDGTSVPLKPNGDQLTVLFEERLEYVKLVKEARLNEMKQQVDAIRLGLLQVIPKAILRLLTSDELEIKICGSPEISFENLQKQVNFNDPSQKDSESAKHLWKALENFSSNDRSQFLRFVTGRRRLPAAVYVDLDSGTDVLPSASTCGHHLSLPAYTSAQKAEEMIRLAIYSSKFIDTDTAIVD